MLSGMGPEAVLRPRKTIPNAQPIHKWVATLSYCFFILCSSEPKELILFSGRLLRGVETTKALTSPPRSQA